MAPENSGSGSPYQKGGLLRDQVQLVKKKDSDRYEIVLIPDTLSLEKGFFAMIRACQLLAQNNSRLIVVGAAGLSGAEKSVLTEKVLEFMPNISVILMDNYNDSSCIIDGNFDDPQLTDYDTLLENIHGLKEGKPFQVPIYGYKSSSRVGYRCIRCTRLSLNLIFRQRVSKLSTSLILSKYFKPYIHLEVSKEKLTEDKIKAVISPEHAETFEETYDVYLLPPGEDPESCQSYLRMRNRDGKYNLMFEVCVTDDPFIMSPCVTFEVSVRLLGGLMALGYTIAAILKRSSHVFSDERVSVEIDWLEQLNYQYVQLFTFLFNSRR